MQLPYTPTNVLHRHGGRILEIVGIKHQTDKPRDGYSSDAWYFTGRVKWNDGSGDESKPQPIDAPMLCSDTEQGAAEIRELSDLMMVYLREHGTWCDAKSKHEGWYAHRKVVA
jgi:hypothetical protein